MQLKGIPLQSKPTMVRYTANSLLSTALDFSVFGFLLHTMQVNTVPSTFVGNVIGAILSYFLLRYWVFADAKPARLKRQMFHFVLGVGLILLTNALLVTFFHHICIWSPWSARIGAAVGAWGVGYLFNRYVVFRADN